jgi:hypothetical protein
MEKKLSWALVALLLSLAGQVQAAEVMTIGGDNLLSDSSATLSTPSPRDALITGFSVNLTGRVEKDAEATGFDVEINAPIGSDLSAAGFTVDINQPIGEDVTATGFSVQLSAPAAVSGNARLFGGTVTIDAPISGSLAAAGGTITLNGSIAGDALITGSKINFGKDAKILGRLTYYAAEPQTVPASVISADRVQFNKLDASQVSDVTTGLSQNAMRRFWPSAYGAVIFVLLILGFLVGTAAVLFSFAPNKMNTWASDATSSPIRSMSLGVLGLSASIGLIPVSVMTLIGIPLAPIAMLVSFVIWIIGYIVGTYALAVRVTGAFRGVPSSMGGRLLMLALAIAVAILLNFIPFLGWLINLALVFLGLGALVLGGARAIAHHQEPAPLPSSTLPTPEPLVQATAVRQRRAGSKK